MTLFKPKQNAGVEEMRPCNASVVLLNALNSSSVLLAGHISVLRHARSSSGSPERKCLRVLEAVGMQVRFRGSSISPSIWVGWVDFWWPPIVWDGKGDLLEQHFWDIGDLLEML